MNQPAMSEARRYQQLRAHLAYLKLNDAADVLPRVLDDARAERLSLTAALERLLEIEVDATEERRLAARLRFACLPEPWTIADSDFSAQPGVDEKLIRDLATLRFLDDASNVLFVGPPGVGKTMLAIALARAAVEAGHRVYFTTAAELAARCHKAAIEGRWNTVMRFFAGPRLLVIDELGYLPAARRRRLRPVPGDQPAIPAIQHHPDYQRRHRRLGRRLRRRHRRRRHARPAPAPRRRRRHLRNAKLQLTAVLVPEEEVPGLYMHPDDRRRLRRAPVRSTLDV